MLRGILAAFGAVVVVTGLASDVYANPIWRSQSETTFVTKKGDSLHGVESDLQPQRFRRLARIPPALLQTADLTSPFQCLKW